MAKTTLTNIGLTSRSVKPRRYFAHGTFIPMFSATVTVMSSTNSGVSFAWILGIIGLVVGVVSNVAYFQQGGRVSLISLGLYPVLGVGLGSWIDGKRGKK